MKILFITLFLITSFLNIFSQNNLCNGADPFCTGLTYNFPAPINSGNAEIGPDYGCLGSTPNPTWFFLNMYQPGNIQIDIHSSNGENINYICWGPFSSITTPCTNGLTSDKIISCSYSSSSQEWCNIPNASAAPCGEYYILLISNYSNQATNIVMVQTNTGQTGSGATNCNLHVCDFNNLTYTISSCEPATNNYSVTGNQIFQIIPSFQLSGQLVIVDQPSGISQVFDGPFSCSTSPIPYTLNNISSDGLQHTLTAIFSEAGTCTYYATYTAPTSCTTTLINSISSKEYFSIFPNPITNGSFKIKYTSQSTGIVRIKILTSQGTAVYNKEYKKDIESIEIPINTVSFSKGYYNIELKSGNNIIRKPIIIQ